VAAITCCAVGAVVGVGGGVGVGVAEPPQAASINIDKIVTTRNKRLMRNSPFMKQICENYRKIEFSTNLLRLLFNSFQTGHPNCANG
jgi:hypothetical protein